MLLLIGAALLAAFGDQPAQHPLLKNDLIEINELTNTGTFNDFDGFLGELLEVSDKVALKETITKFRTGDMLSDIERINLYRLLGLFVRHQYQDDLLATLDEMVGIRTDSIPGVRPYENPEIIRFGKTIEKYAAQFNLVYKNYDNRLFEVVLKGNGGLEGSFGVVTHGDVVPADKEKWKLEDGTQLDPYKMTIIGDKIYGRGTEDDKAAIATALYSMKAIAESGLAVKRDIRLLIETTEENGGSGFAYFRRHHDVPQHNVVLDNLYPVVTAEKGFAIIAADFPLREATGSGIEIVNITGGLAITQIPASSTITLRTPEPEKVKKILEARATKFVGNHSQKVTFEISVVGDQTVMVNINGESAHSSSPWTGVNPIPPAFVFLYEAAQAMPFRDNHFSDAARYVYDNYGLDLYGQKMGIDYSDEFMGPLTVTLTTVTFTETHLKIGVTARLPRGKEIGTLKMEIENKLEAYKSVQNLEFDNQVRVWNFMYRNPESAFISTLLNIYGEITGNESKPVSSNGGTTAKYLPNAVSFGPSMPGEKYMGHTANEFKKISNLLLDMQMYTEMILRIGNQHEL